MGTYRVSPSKLDALEKVTTLKDRVDMHSILPHLSDEPVVGVPVEIDQGKYWRFLLYWCGVQVAEVAAEYDNKGALCLEML